jgi:hypothetical protein
VTDLLHFHLNNGVSQQVQLEAYGQNVHRLKGSDGRLFVNSYIFADTLPYLIYDTMVIDGKKHYRCQNLDDTTKLRWLPGNARVELAEKGA